MRTLLIIISLLAATSAYCQSAPQVTVSDQKVKVDGCVVYVHKVKGGETLYSLAKAYNVPIDDIVRQNESLKSGLKEGTIIYIPSSAAADTGNTPIEPAAVQQKEGKKGIDGWYLSGENIKKYSQKKYKVKKGETLEDIAAKYGITADAIVAMNNLRSTTLTKKQLLYIPTAQFLELLEEDAGQQQSPAQEQQEETDKEDTQQTQLAEEEIASKDEITFNASSLTYILPLSLSDTLGPNTNFMDFYAGALMAADTLKRMGHSISVNLVDQMLYTPAQKFENTVIIGPVRSSDMMKFLPEAGEGNIVISPMDMNTGSLVKGNSNFVQIAPDIDDQMENLMDLLAGKTTLGNSVMIIYEKNGADGDLVESAKRLANEKGIIYNTLSYNILEGREMMDKIKDVLEPGLDNLVLIPSNSEAFVSDVVRNLNLLYTNPLEENRRSVVLFGTPRWRNFESIEVDYFHKMNLHLSIPYYVDYSKRDVKDFLMKYRALFNGEPTPFAFQGYDITMMSCGYPQAALQAKFRFKKDNAGDGAANAGTTNIVYNKDYTISVIE